MRKYGNLGATINITKEERFNLEHIFRTGLCIGTSLNLAITLTLSTTLLDVTQPRKTIEDALNIINIYILASDSDVSLDVKTR